MKWKIIKNCIFLLHIKKFVQLLAIVPRKIGILIFSNKNNFQFRCK